MGVKNSYTECPCGGWYLILEMHERAQRHREWRGGQPEIPVPPQPPPAAYDALPDRIVFGDTIVCPMCLGRMPRLKKGDKPNPEKMFTREKKHPQNPCPRCDGLGYVPNTGA